MSGSILQWGLARFMGRELPIQQLSQTRKFIYLGLILILFTASWSFRHYFVETQAAELALREQDVGAVELSGSAIRLSLTGLRGVATCVLWINAMEKQKKNQWDELEILVNSVTKLQPHFITPWLFQSWNLSYNVAVKCDLPRDKYFYIGRGLDLLAEGERQNQNDPDMRFAMGTYYQQKITNADLKEPLQALFEMSFIDPVQRDPEQFRLRVLNPQTNKVEVLDPLKAWAYCNRHLEDQESSRRLEEIQKHFEEFCQQHPRLVRRLREKLDCSTPEPLLRFLEENAKIPSLFGDKVNDDGVTKHTQLKKNREKPFPVLPQRPWDPDRLPSMEEMEGEADAFVAAKAWYKYAQEALPPPSKEIPGASQEIEDHFRQRIPRHLTTVIFRDYPARAQSYVAERLDEEGWFDESGWKITGWFPRDRFRRLKSKDHPSIQTEVDADGPPTVVGNGRKWSADAWNKAFDLWRDYGESNRLMIPPEQVQQLQALMAKFREAHNIPPEQAPGPLPPLDKDNPQLVAGWKAWQFLFNYDYYRTLTNFPHHYFRSQAESQPEMIQARKDLFEAEQLRLAAKSQALPLYEKALLGWRDKVFAKFPELRHDDLLLEDIYEAELNYLQFYNDSPAGRQLKQGLFVEGVLGTAATPAVGEQLVALTQLLRPQASRIPLFVGPLDGKIPGRDDYWIDPDIRQRVLVRKGIVMPVTPASMMPPGGMPPGMGGGPPRPMPPPVGIAPGGPEGQPPKQP
jgi:hypothetical protein